MLFRARNVLGVLRKERLGRKKREEPRNEVVLLVFNPLTIYKLHLVIAFDVDRTHSLYRLESRLYGATLIE